jgi:hypothetical protein
VCYSQDLLCPANSRRSQNRILGFVDSTTWPLSPLHGANDVSVGTVTYAICTARDLQDGREIQLVARLSTGFIYLMKELRKTTSSLTCLLPKGSTIFRVQWLSHEDH